MRNSTNNKNIELNKSGKTLKCFALKLRIYPNLEQIEYFNNAFGCSRALYNTYLYKRINLYNNFKETYYLNDFKKYLSFLKKTEEYNYLKDIDKFALETAVEQVDIAYNNFFSKQSGFPKFKEKKSNKQSYTTKFTNNNIRINLKNNKYLLQIPKIKELKFAKPKSSKNKDYFQLILDGEAIIKSATISKKSSKYYIALNLQQEVNMPKNLDLEALDPNKVVGIDLGLKDFAIISNGTETQKIENPKFYKKTEVKIKKLQKSLSKKRKDSKNYIKNKQKLQEAHEKIKNQRNDFLHKQSLQIINENQVIILEDLNIKGMIKNKRLAKSISDCSWYAFINMLKYKAKWNGKIVLQIDRFYASSKTCNICKDKNIMLTLNERSWVCNKCGTVHDRDINAALNIREEGLKILLT